jgi:hypothetical protein
MNFRRRTVYVEIPIHASMDRLWELTQTPGLHQQWDLRFTQIQYLPRPDPAQPQKFLYTTRIGFGLSIRGEGQTVGEHSAAGERSSALQFGSQDPKSLILAGSGYWKYVPTPNHIRFLTAYDYTVRFGLAGRVFDAVIFRPLIGWATAWSFDRLRLWIERDIHPAISLQRALINAIARLTLAFAWLYQGLVPKLLARHRDELALFAAAGLHGHAALAACFGLGCAEVALGILILLAWRSRWPLWLTLVLMPAAILDVIFTAPAYLAAAFNPVSLNMSLFGLALAALLSQKDLPSSSRCLRKPHKGST